MTSCNCRAIHIDGATGSGSGTIVRTSVQLAALTGTRLHVVNARARRPQPGLRPQHLTVLRACADLCDGKAEGFFIGSREFLFLPGSVLRGGDYAWDIGTAGSTTMLVLSLLPLGALSARGLTARLTGGVFQDFAPSPFHLQHVVLPALARMGVKASLKLERAGYVPKGGGVLRLDIRPRTAPLRAFEATGRDSRQAVRGIALASRLQGREVSERMARACERRLEAAGIRTSIERVEDAPASSPGAALAVWTVGGCFGADQAGARGRRAEKIGAWVAARLLDELAGDATVDRHLADMLVPFAALAAGESRWRAPLRTEHLETNLWLVEHFGARTSLEATSVVVHGFGHTPVTEHVE